MIRWNILKTVFNCKISQNILKATKKDLLFCNQRDRIQTAASYAGFHTSNKVHFKDEVTLHFTDRTGTRISVRADVGDNILDVAKDADIDGVEGACGGTLACSTCHCIFKQEDFDRLGLDDICEDELDMLDLAFGLTDTSRLVCSLEVVEEMDGIEITVPIATRDARD